MIPHKNFLCFGPWYPAKVVSRYYRRSLANTRPFLVLCDDLRKCDESNLELPSWSALGDWTRLRTVQNENALWYTNVLHYRAVAQWSCLLDSIHWNDSISRFVGVLLMLTPRITRIIWGFEFMLRSDTRIVSMHPLLVWADISVTLTHSLVVGMLDISFLCHSW